MPNSFSGSSGLPLSGGTLSGHLTMGAAANILLAASSTVDGVDVSALNRLKMLDGTYTGDGYGARDINIGVNLTAKTHWMVLVKSITTYKAVYCTDYFVSSQGIPFDAAAHLFNSITGVHTTGFSVNSADETNKNTVGYLYWVIYED